MNIYRSIHLSFRINNNNYDAIPNQGSHSFDECWRNENRQNCFLMTELIVSIEIEKMENKLGVEVYSQKNEQKLSIQHLRGNGSVNNQIVAIVTNGITHEVIKESHIHICIYKQ